MHTYTTEYVFKAINGITWCALVNWQISYNRDSITGSEIIRAHGAYKHVSLAKLDERTVSSCRRT